MMSELLVLTWRIIILGFIASVQEVLITFGFLLITIIIFNIKLAVIYLCVLKIESLSIQFESTHS